MEGVLLREDQSRADFVEQTRRAAKDAQLDYFRHAGELFANTGAKYKAHSAARDGQFAVRARQDAGSAARSGSWE